MTELTPGQLLVAAREQRGLSQIEVAKQLRLSVQTVRDLEKDDYAAIVSEISEIFRISEIWILDSNNKMIILIVL